MPTNDNHTPPTPRNDEADDPTLVDEEATPEPHDFADDSGPTEDTSAHDTSPEVTDDDWEKFAAGQPLKEEPRPGRFRRTLTRVRGFFTHEWTLATVASIALAIAMTWPVAAAPHKTIPHDLGDPLLLTYMLAWLGHVTQEAFTGNFTDLWDSNSFWPASDSHLFTDSLLGYAPAAAAITDNTTALLVYNALYIGSFALAFLGCYALLRQLGARTAASAVGAAAFAFAPWKIAQAGHLQVLSIGAIALALAMLARGHGWSLRNGFNPDKVRPGWIFAGWLTALWQVSIGMGMGIPFIYLLLAIAIVSGLFLAGKRLPIGWWGIAANGLGGIIFSLGVLWIGDQHLRIASAYPEAGRSWEYLQEFSPTWSSFIIAPEQSWLWGSAHEPARESLTWPPEQTLLVGFTVLGLAIAGLIWSSWSPRQRVFLGLGVLATMALALGPNFLDNGEWAYQLLFEYVPGFEAIRTPGRLVLYMSLLLAVLAAGTITHLANRADQLAHANRLDKRLTVKAPRRVQALFFLPLPLILAEGISTAETHEPPESPVALAELDGPILVLPADGRDTVVQYWSIDGFPEIANGTAAFTPNSQAAIQADSLDFPEPESIEALRDAGINTVVVVPDWLPGSDWEGLDVDAALWGVEVEQLDQAVVFRL